MVAAAVDVAPAVVPRGADGDVDGVVGRSVGSAGAAVVISGRLAAAEGEVAPVGSGGVVVTSWRAVEVEGASPAPHSGAPVQPE
mmetsp:Transcript_148492/g.458851  ORF Transcript_148492/g.458851 Transcript_148492/m.458851 type:complete len:84 (+) Transcript_148492:713-964(+)